MKSPNYEEFQLWGLKQPQDYEQLRSPRIFLKQAGFDFDNKDVNKQFQELQTLLLNTRYINPRRTLSISLDNTCNLDEKAIENDPTSPSNEKEQRWQAILNRSRRFLRLQRKLGWSISDLDKTIATFNASLDEQQGDTFLQQVSHIEQLRKEFKIPVLELLTWWGQIDTWEDWLTTEENQKKKSLYEQLFLPKAIDEAEYHIFKLNQQRNDLAREKYLLNLSTLDEQILIHHDSFVLQHVFSILDRPITISPDLTFNHNAELDIWQITDNVPVEYQTFLFETFLLKKLEDDTFDVYAILDYSRITEHVTSVLAAIKISEADLKRLIKTSPQDKDREVPDKLSLEHLSHLYRIVSFAKALKLSIKEFLLAKSVIGIDSPFKNINTTLKFIKKLRRIEQSDFSIAELAYILNQQYEPNDNIAPSKLEIAQNLVEIRKEISKKISEFQDVAGTSASVAETRLATVLDRQDTSEVIAMLRSYAVYTAPLVKEHILNAEKKSIFDRLKAPLKNKIKHSQDILTFSGVMSLKERDTLLALSNGADYQTAIRTLFDQPRNFVDSRLAIFLDPNDAKKQLLDGVPKKLTVEEKFQYILNHLNPVVLRMHSVSIIKQQLSAALDLPADITSLLLEDLIQGRIFQKQTILEDLLPLGSGSFSAAYYDGDPFDNKLFTDKPVTELIESTIEFKADQYPGPAPQPNPLSVSWESMVFAEKGGSYGFIVKTSDDVRLWVDNDLIVDEWPNQPVKQTLSTKIALEAGKYHFIRVEYRTSNPTGSITLLWQPPEAETPQVLPSSKCIPTGMLASYLYLHRIALLVRKFSIPTDELLYITSNSDDFEKLNLNNFGPDSTTTNEQLVNQWQCLNNIFQFRNLYSHPEIRLIDIFQAAHQGNLDEAKQQLFQLASWHQQGLDVEEFKTLVGVNGFYLSANDLKKGKKFNELHQAVRLLRQLGISVQQFIQWITVNLDVLPQDDDFVAKKSIPHVIRNIAKAKYDPKQWLKIAKPIRDRLRNKQRAALVAYLVHDYGLKNSNQLYEKFLIDVEMAPCMQISRLKQAISSVQLFVQRCLMGLEPDVALTEDSAKEWKWRKYYRVWEANRKVFLYPENWIEPELRDDKSPFFEDLENELLQDEVREDTVEAALLDYLYKLEEVARLDIVGMYEQMPEDSSDTYVLHVFGRTINTPYIYYYRKWIDRKYWTAWEGVDLDIEGDHLLPVIWNRRLYLFWPIFRPGAEINKGSSEVNETIDIHMAWSHYDNGKWHPKKVTERVYSLLEFINFKLHITTREPDQEFLVSEMISSRHVDQKPLHIVLKPLPPENTFDLRIGLYVAIPDFNKFCGRFRFLELIFSNCQSEVELLYVKYESYKSLKNTNLDFQKVLPPPNTYVNGMQFLEEPLDTDDNLRLWKDSVSSRNQNINNKTPIVLRETPGKYQLLYSHQKAHFTYADPFFYKDKKRTFFVYPAKLRRTSRGEAYYILAFKPFYHRFVCSFIQHLNRYGIDGLLNPPSHSELFRQQGNYTGFFDEYSPSHFVLKKPSYPIEDIDFSFGGSYSQYNWEIFFHIPLLIADRLSQNQRFEEAMKWYHYIFDPTETQGGKPPGRYWKLRPFYEPYQEENGKPKRIHDLMRLLNGKDVEQENLVDEWEKDPFKPHLIARRRTGAYMKTVVMKYLDNLIAWGDMLFRRDTMESNVEAAQLYILAAEILGDRPAAISAKNNQRKSLIFSELEELGLDVFSNAELENLLPESPSIPLSTSGKTETLTLPSILYFCIPNNAELLEYWNKVEDRLFKIRNCMNIKGVVRQLPLFQPPIDPALLVRAAAAGLDLGSVLNDLYAPSPHYRFQVMLQKATELCAEVKSLGASLLSALEKKDAEELSVLRAGHEKKLLEVIKSVKEKNKEETVQSRESLDKTSDMVSQRNTYYSELKKKGLNSNESEELSKLRDAQSWQQMERMTEIGAAVAHAVPQETITKTGIEVTFGGRHAGSVVQAAGKLIGMLGILKSYEANRNRIQGGNLRREDGWQFQIDSTAIEKEQINKQIAAADIRKEIAEKDLNNHIVQIDNSKTVETYLRNKFTNKQLYSWMISRISTVYFQSYQLAYDIAKQAEKAYCYELGLDDSNFIQFGYWDSLKKGLLSGEKLYHDLKRMEMAYLENNKREYELTKHISLALLDPIALLQLRETGECYISIPEALFDLDHPGHYMRRIKTISLTIPCVTGPYTNVSATLTLQSNRIRKKTSMSTKTSEYKWDGDFEDDRFNYNLGGIQSIATSSGQNDSGLFELNFRDERYLPFEGAGAISTWHIQLPKKFRQFDYDTISDVVMHMRYTAREGGGSLKDAATQTITDLFKQIDEESQESPLFQLFSAKQEFSSEWHQFLHPKDSDESHKLDLSITPNRFPFQFRGKAITIGKVEIFLQFKDIKDAEKYKSPNTPLGKDAVGTPLGDYAAGTTPLELNLIPPKQQAVSKSLNSDVTDFSGTPHAVMKISPPHQIKSDDIWQITASSEDVAKIQSSLRWSIKVTEQQTLHRLQAEAIDDLILVCHYSVQ